MLRIVTATLAAAATAVTAVPLGVSDAQAGTTSATPTYDVNRTILSPEITQSSGLAHSTYDRPLLWTHNDRGDSARIFGVGAGGYTRATVRLDGVTQVDFEAIAPGPGHTLWVGDIGDNTASRARVQVYRVTEPKAVGPSTVKPTRFDLKFPDGAHDAEALLVHPTTGRVYVVTKGATAGAVYRAPATLSTSTVNVLTKVASAPAKVSDGTFTVDGQGFALTNDTTIYSYTAFGATPTTTGKPAMAAGESLTVSRDGTRFLVGSEGIKSPVYDVPVASAPVVTPPPTDGGVVDPRTGARNPLLWPYPSKSIWNYPLGRDAKLVPLHMTAPTNKTVSVEDELLFINPDAPRKNVLEHNAGWDPHKSRCSSLTGRTLKTGVPIENGFATDPGFYGRTPNHSSAVVMPDMTLFESQPLHVCADGKVVSQHDARAWQGDSILTGGMPEDTGAGSHGGSGMTAFGGTIRLGEWVPGGEIPHVIKIEVDATKYLWGGAGDRYRWPARNADRTSSVYGGTVHASRMGSLLALPPTFDVSSLSTEPARILATTLQKYGAYVVDSTGRSTVAFATEWGPQGRVTKEFEQSWGYPLDGRAGRSTGAHHSYLKDMEQVYAALAVVDDNAPTNVGGAGERMAPWAPPLA